MSGGLIKLTGGNGYTGSTTVSTGTLQIGNGGTTGSLAATAVTVASGATFAENLSSNYTATAATGSGNLSYYSGGQLAMSGTYSANQIAALAGNQVYVNGPLYINAGAGSAVITGTSSGGGGILTAVSQNITTTGNVTFTGTSSAGAFTSGLQIAGNFTASTGTLTFDGTSGPSGCFGIEDGVSGGWAAGINTYGYVVFKGTGHNGGGHIGDIGLGNLTGNGTVVLIGRNEGLDSNGTFTATGGLPYNVVLQTTNGASINGALGSGTDTTGGGNYTINSAGSVTFGGRTINAGSGTISLTSASGYNVTASSSLQGGSLVMGDANAIALSSGVTLTLNATGSISNAVNGSNGNLAVTGGSITLAGANSYSGSTTVSGGTLTFSGATTSNASTAMSIAGGAVLQYAVPSGLRDENTVTYSGAGTLLKTGSGTLRWGAGVGTFKLASGSLIDVQGGTFDAGSTANEVWSANLSSLNVAGGATISEITYNAAQFDALTGSGTVAMSTGYGGPNQLTLGVNNTAAGQYNPAGSATFSGVISGGPATLIKAGTGMQVLSGNNTYSGATSITAGTLAINGSLASGSTVGIGGSGTLAGSGLIGGNTTVTGNGAIYLSGGTIGGTLAATGGNWNGTGTVGSSITSSSNTFTIGSGANLIALAGLNVTGGALAGAGTLSGSLNYTSPAASSFPGNITGNGAAVTLGSGAGVLTLTGSNTYTGATNVNASTLIVNGTHSGGGAYTIASGATLSGTGTISGGNTVTLNAGGFIAPGAVAGNNNVGTLTLPNFATSGSGTIDFDLAFATTAGNGVNDLVAVSGNLSLGGTTNIAVNLHNTTVLSNGNYELFSYGGSLTGNASSLALANSGFLTSRQTYQFDTGTSHAIFLDIIGGPANLTWTGSNAASWDTSSSTANWIDQNSTPNNFVTGDMTNFTTSNSGAVTINAPVAPGSVNVSGSYTFNGPGKITGATALTVQSPAALVIANTNDYTLGTNLQSGSIILGTNNALPVAGTVTMGLTSSRGTLDLAGYSQTIGNLAMGAGASGSLGYQQTITASTGSSTLTVNGAGDSIYGGTITDAAPSGGTLGLTVSNGTLDLTSGTLAYTGLPTATYHGATTVNSGVLLAATLPNTSAVAVNGGSLSATSYSGSANLSVAGGAAASISGGNLSLAGVSNSGSVNFTASTGTISLTGLSGNGTTTFAAGASFPTLSAGLATVAGPAAIGSATGGTANLNGATVSIGTLSGAIVNLGPAAALSLTNETSGQIAGAGGVTVPAGVTTTLAASNTYSGGTTLSAGLLNINADAALGGTSGTVTFVGNGTLQAGANNIALAAAQARSAQSEHHGHDRHAKLQHDDQRPDQRRRRVGQDRQRPLDADQFQHLQRSHRGQRRHAAGGQRRRDRLAGHVLGHGGHGGDVRREPQFRLYGNARDRRRQLVLFLRRAVEHGRDLWREPNHGYCSGAAQEPACISTAR